MFGGATIAKNTDFVYIASILKHQVCGIFTLFEILKNTEVVYHLLRMQTNVSLGCPV